MKKVVEAPIAHLKKGDVIPAEKLELWSGHGRETQAFSFYAMGLGGRIERQLGIVCRQDGGDLRLLRDSEAVDYVPQRFEVHARGIRRSVRRIQDIDESKLNNEELARKRETEMVQSRVAQSMSREQRRVKRRLKMLKERKV